MEGSIKKIWLWIWPAIKYSLIWLILTVATVGVFYFIGFIVMEAAGYHIDKENIVSNPWLMGGSLTCADLLLLLVFWKRGYTRNWFKYGFTYGEGFSTSKLCLGAVVGAIGFLLLDILVQEYAPIPIDSELDEWFAALFGSPIGILSICLIGPLAEEAIFRGAIERRLLETNWSPWFAIVISALLFALAHGNYGQGVTAVISGCFMGWVYYRTRSIWPTFLIHAVNNTTAVIAAYSIPESMVEEGAETLGVPLSVGVPLIVVSIVLLYIAAKGIAKLTNDRTPIPEPVPVGEVLPPPFPNAYVGQDVPVGDPLDGYVESGIPADGFDTGVDSTEPDGSRTDDYNPLDS